MVARNGSNGTANQLVEDIFQTQLTEESYAQLAELEGAAIVGVGIWEGSVADVLEEEIPDNEARSVVDLDLYLEDNVLLELYGTVLYPSPETDALVGLTAIENALVKLIDSDGILREVAQSEDEALVLILSANRQLTLYAVVSAWVVDEWDDLPEE